MNDTIPEPSARRDFSFPVPADHFDVISLFLSLFPYEPGRHRNLTCAKSGMRSRWEAKFSAALSSSTRVKDEEENPVDYYRDWDGPLHCVRINRFRFEELVYASGLIVDYFRYRHTNDGQSTYVLSRGMAPDSWRQSFRRRTKRLRLSGREQRVDRDAILMLPTPEKKNDVSQRIRKEIAKVDGAAPLEFSESRTPYGF